MKEHGNTLEVLAKIRSRAVSRNLEAASSTTLDVINVYHTNKLICLGKHALARKRQFLGHKSN